MAARFTVTFPAELLQEIDLLIADGAVHSRSQFVAEALRRELRRVKVDRIDAVFYELANDPELLRQEDAVMTEFEQADSEAFRLGEAGYRAQRRSQ